MNWEKYLEPEAKPREIKIPISEGMDNLMEAFRMHYGAPEVKDARILMTFAEAGAKLWFHENLSQEETSE